MLRHSAGEGKGIIARNEIHRGRIPRRFLASIRRPGRVGVEPFGSARRGTGKVTPSIERRDQLVRDGCTANDTAGDFDRFFIAAEAVFYRLPAPQAQT
ncbi:hypothetical protein PCANC_06995 [Puccinia coronata f. sp. avenae]|uniref:Uncharacterized protein n=1 Tax=Puccinia coronata f. sp. avenae TaxID=200324 RepID=A0A2N5UZJ9_9BASI|nr:hypothetical protein PCANC_06995 [Puccinia coronata f. sp. avenae]